MEFHSHNFLQFMCDISANLLGGFSQAHSSALGKYMTRHGRYSTYATQKKRESSNRAHKNFS